MKEAEFNNTMETIVSALRERGYDPYAQLYGYLREDNPLYITQHRNAREMVLLLDKKQIREYIAPKR